MSGDSEEVEEEDAGFSGPPTHVVLVVKCRPKKGGEGDAAPGDEEDGKEDGAGPLYYADVGFGEPPIHPLRYGGESFGKEQETPEGMRCKIVRRRRSKGGNGDGDDDSVVLYWWKKGGWVPRMKWSYTASVLPRERRPTLRSFEKALKMVQHPDSIFSKKLIACLLTRGEKTTLAGNRFKVTGLPRFPPPPLPDGDGDGGDEKGGSDYYPPGESSIPPASAAEMLDGADRVRRVLLERFGMPMEETADLDLSKSLAADPSIWSHQ